MRDPSHRSPNTVPIFVCKRYRKEQSHTTKSAFLDYTHHQVHKSKRVVQMGDGQQQHAVSERTAGSHKPAMPLTVTPSTTQAAHVRQKRAGAAILQPEPAHTDICSPPCSYGCTHKAHSLALALRSAQRLKLLHFLAPSVKYVPGR
jgi:hypothetical protein